MSGQKAVRVINVVERPDGVREIHSWKNKVGGQVIKAITAEPGDGLRKFNKEKTAPGYVFYTPDHSKKFLLINLEGEIVNEWEAWTSHFGFLLPHGNLMCETQFANDRPYGVLERDWAGNEVWFHECPAHHDFQRLENGNTMIICDREMECPEIWPDGPILSSYLIEVTPEGKVVWEWYSEEHLEELKRLAGVTFPRDDPDWVHTNTVQVIPETPAARDPRFKRGNVIVSHRNLDLALVIEKGTGEIVWTFGPGLFDRQHATYLQDDGSMICFDNGRVRRWSAIWECDPLSGEVLWSYKGDPPSSFFADALSNAHRLPNGNIFVCSGSKPDDGRLFELTRDGEIVWEFQNPYAEYAEGRKIVYRGYKYPPEMIDPLL